MAPCRQVRSASQPWTSCSQEFLADGEIYAVEIDDPYVGGDRNRFAIRFSFDSTFRSTGVRRTYSKVSRYTVSAGLMVREEVYYNDSQFHQPGQAPA